MKKLLIAFILLSSIILFSSFVMEEIENNKKKDFYTFLSYFDKSELPLEIKCSDFEDSKFIQLKTKRKSIKNPLLQSDFIPSYPIGSFSRMGPPTLEAVNRFYPADNQVAVIYSSRPQYGAYNKSFYMIIYDFNGNILSKDFREEPGAILIASSTAENVKTASIDEQRNIKTTDYEITWKYDLSKIRINENEIMSYNKISSAISKIEDKGTVSEFKEINLITKA